MEARALLVEALTIERDLGRPYDIALALEGMGYLAAAESQAV